MGNYGGFFLHHHVNVDMGGEVGCASYVWLGEDGGEVAYFDFHVLGGAYELREIPLGFPSG